MPRVVTGSSQLETILALAPGYIQAMMIFLGLILLGLLVVSELHRAGKCFYWDSQGTRPVDDDCIDGFCEDCRRVF